MKRYIIKIIYVLLTLLIVMQTGCNKNGVIENSGLNVTPQQTQNIDKQIKLNIYTYALRWRLEMVENGLSESYNSWQKQIKDKFNIDVTINKNLSLRNGYFDALDLFLETNAVKDGIYEVKYDTFKKLQTSKSIIAIDDYINGNIRELIDDYNELVFLENQTWAIPLKTFDYENIYVRGFNKDWLDNIGYDVPNSIDELYEVALAFVYKDPNQNSIDDTYGIFANDLYSIYDIFNSFGIFYPKSNASLFSYNYETSKYENSFLNDNMVVCLEWLQLCYENGVFSDDFIPNYIYSFVPYKENYLKNCEFGSIGNDINQFTENMEYLEFSIGYKNSYSAYNNMYIEEFPTFYVLGKDNKEPKETMHTFIDTFYNDNIGYLIGRFGAMTNSNIEGNFSLNNNQVILKGSSCPEIFKTNKIYSQYEVVNSNNNDNFVKDVAQKLFNQGNRANMIYNMPLLEYDNMLEKCANYNIENDFIVIDYSQIIYETIKKAVTEDVNVNELIQAVNRELSLMGLDRLIEELEEKIKQ